MPVLVSKLRVDPSVAAASPKGYTDAELNAIMARIPEIYDLLDQGMSQELIRGLRNHPGLHMRELGTTYTHVFGAAPFSHVLAADVVNGRLEVTKGNHRIRAARRVGVDVLPVEVSARTAAELDTVADDARRADPARYMRYEATHTRVADRAHNAGPEREPDRRPTRDRQESG